jgi:quercetin dioxygenase-like cupin family protein
MVKKKIQKTGLNLFKGGKMAKKTKEVSLGKKIKKVRLDKSITLDFIANETGMKKEYIKKIEAGDEIPSVGTMIQLSRALGIDSNALIKQEKDTSDKRKKAHTKRTDNYAYTPLSSEGSNKHLKAFKIVVQAGKHHGGVGFRHEGEEFVYVLKGKVEVDVGENVNSLKTGDSLHFNSGIKHDLKNVGKEDAELIVIVYAP